MSRLLRTVLPGVGVVAVLGLVAAGCSDGGPSTGSPPSPTASAPAEPSEPPGGSPSPTASDRPIPDASATAPAPGAPVRGLPDGVDGTMDSRAGAAWSPEPGRLYVVTYGSSTCARVADPQAPWDDAREAVVVDIQEPTADAVCTMDYVPTTSLVVVPGDADTGAPLTVRLGDSGEVRVAPRAAEREPGPVAWLGS